MSSASIEPKFGVARVVGSTMLIRGLALASSLLFTSALSFMMPKSDYGVIAMLMSLVLFSAAFGEFGQRELAAREVSKALAQQQPDAASSWATFSTRLAAIAGVLVALIVSMGLVLLNYGWPVAVAAGFTIFFLSLNAVWSGVARAYGQFAVALLPREVLWRSMVVGAVALLGWAGMVADAAVAASFMALSMAICLLFQFWSLGRKKFGSFGVSLVGSDFPALVRAGRDLALTNVGGLILITADVVAVGILIGPLAAAEYFPANRMAILTFYFHTTLQLVISPRLARCHALGETEKFRSLAVKSARFSFLYSLTSLLVVVLARPFFPLVFGTATDATWLSTVVLSAGFTICAGLGFGASMIIAADGQALLRRIMVWSVPLSVLLLFAAMQFSSIVLVSITVALATVTRVLVVTFAARRRLGFAGTIFG